MKKALVLGSGGARGLAHIGVLRVLEKEGFKPDLIVGCSIGAIIGGMYAQTPHIQKVEERIRKFFASNEYHDLNIDKLERGLGQSNGYDFLHHIARNLMRRVLVNMVANKSSIMSQEKLDEAVKFLINKGDIQDTNIPFACNAVNLVDGKPVLFQKGDIREAIRASSSIPGYLPPVRSNSNYLVDGAVAFALPIKYARSLGADFIISSDVRQEMQPQREFSSVFDIILRVNTITLNILYDEICRESDIHLKPEVGSFNWYEFEKMDGMIRAGEEAAQAHISEIRTTIGRKHHFFKKLFNIN